MDGAPDLASVRRALEAAGCVAATDEAEELIRTARGGSDLEGMLQRRLGGEPLEWITGRASFCGLTVPIGPGVYVPRWQSEPLARMAARLLPPNGLAVDLATGSGAIALAVRAARPGARIVGTEIDPVAARWARANGVVVYEGNLDEALPAELASQVDVMIGVLPYVPTDALHLLPRDVQRFEPRRALDGGEGGLELIGAVVGRSPRWLRPGGWLLLELGGDQTAPVAALLAASGFVGISTMQDEEGDPRGVYARLGG